LVFLGLGVVMTYFVVAMQFSTGDWLFGTILLLAVQGLVALYLIRVQQIAMRSETQTDIFKKGSRKIRAWICVLLILFANLLIFLGSQPSWNTSNDAIAGSFLVILAAGIGWVSFLELYIVLSGIKIRTQS